LKSPTCCVVYVGFCLILAVRSSNYRSRGKPEEKRNAEICRATRSESPAPNCDEFGDTAVVAVCAARSRGKRHLQTRRDDQNFSHVAAWQYAGDDQPARVVETAINVIAHRQRALEERLGVRLLNRTTRSLSLTEAGAAYYERCRRIIDQVQAAETSLGAVQGTLTGTLSKLDWRNPHIELVVDTKNSAGQVEAWSFEGPPPSFFRTRDINKSDIETSLGKNVTAEASRARDGSHAGLLRVMTLSDGKVVSACPQNC
jgi:hypothetical protein